MKLTLDQSEMLALWKRRHFIEPLRADCTIERTDGIDIDARCREEMRALYDEMAALETQEAQIYKALDKLEAVISHNESDISTWEDHEYDLQLTYGEQNVAFSPYLTALRQAVRQESLDKIAREGDRRK